MRSNSEAAVLGQDEFNLPLGVSRAGAGLGGTVDVRPVGVEQSNSSIVFGEQLTVKAFRLRRAGREPGSLQLLRFLSARVLPLISSPLAGWYELRGPPRLTRRWGSLQEYLAGARDGGS